MKMKLWKLWISGLLALGFTFMPALGQDASADADQEKEQDVRKPGRPGPKKPGKPSGKKPGKPDSNKPERPERPERPEIPDELKTKMEAYKKESQALRQELKSAIGKIENPTREQIGEASSTFREANKKRYESQKGLIVEIRDGLKAIRPERPEKPELSDEAKALREKHAALLKSMGENKKNLREALAKATEDERKELFENFREQQEKLSAELKALHKEIRESIGDRPDVPGVDGKKPPRRPKPGAIRPGNQRRPAER
jgi:Skp family chaperone for outer membrane proteins